MFALASLAVLALAISVRADASISTAPSLTLCQPATFKITDGSPTDKYTAYVVYKDDPCGDAIAEIENLSGDSFTWTVNVKADKPVQIALDNGSNEIWTGPMTIGGSDTSCFNSAARSGGSSTAASSSTSTRPASTYVAPVNAASAAPSASIDSTTSGASRSVGSITSAFALIGAAAVALSL